MIPSLDIEGALSALSEGRVIAVPTDTVYGVAASLEHPEAIASLFSLKRRPTSVALPILVDSIGQIEACGVDWPLSATTLAAAFWPGPLTIVVSVPEHLAALVGSATSSAGFRIPNDEGLRAILSRSGPLCVTSANNHGDPPCQSASQVRAAFDTSTELAGIVDAGDRAGTVSTVVELSEGTWHVLREGAIDASAIAAILGEGGTITR